MTEKAQATEIWFTEKQTPDVHWSCRVKKTLYSKQTSYQQLDILETEPFGRMMILDGMVMLTEQDEFAYHELLTHVAMNTHPEAKQILIVGGGDGGAIREVLRHPTVKQVVLAEIDQTVIEAAKRFFPHIASSFDDERVEIQISDGMDYVQQHPNQFDVILVDSTEPIGPGEKLFTKRFYQAIHHALKADGLMVAQTESPWLNQSLIQQTYQHIAEIFPITRLYMGSVPTYPSGTWTFTLGSKQYDPLKVDETKLFAPDETKYYHPQLHHALFQLPRFVQQLLGIDP